MGVTRVRGEQLLLGVDLVLTWVCHEARRAGEIVQVVLVARPAVHHDGPLLCDAQRGDDGGGGVVVSVGSLLWVIRQRVTTTQDQGDALANRHRLKEFNHVGVGGPQDAHVIDVNNDVTCKEKNRRKVM